MGKNIKELPIYWSNPDSIHFFSKTRKTKTDLYDSEKVFLPRLLKKNMKVLDVGCATGGFYNIMKEIEPKITYYGCDFTTELIKIGKKKHRKAKFIAADSLKLPFKKNYFDLVNCSGTCHMIPDYFTAIKQMYRVTKKFCIFDLRLTDKTIDFDLNKCYQKLCFDDKWDGKSVGPYRVVNIKDLLNKLLNRLTPKPKSIYATGYLRQPAKTVVIPLKKVCMAVFMLEKPCNKSMNTEFCLDIPYDYNKQNTKNEKWISPNRLNKILGEK